MPLTATQLQNLEQHLRENMRLSKQDFIAEMLDHYSCAMEQALAHGATWETALHQLDKAFGGRKGLRKMEKHFMENAYQSFVKHYAKVIRSYFYQIPNVLATLAFGLLVLAVYDIEHTWLYIVLKALMVLLLMVGTFGLATGIYYWVKSRDTQQAYIARQYGLLMFAQINFINLISVFSADPALPSIWLVLPIAVFQFVMLMVGSEALWANYKRMRLKLPLA